jgi:hypothetical protein
VYRMLASRSSRSHAAASSLTGGMGGRGIPFSTSATKRANS